jgi:hypothetical protein
MINVGFSTPAPGTGVGRTLTVTGFTENDGQVDNQGHDQFQLLQILVRFAPGPQQVKATVNQDGTWSATGTVPSTIQHGNPVDITFTADVLATSSSGDQPSGYEVIDTLHLVAEQTPPQVIIDPFLDDRTVEQLPFRLPVLSGRALDSSGITSVQYTLDGGPRLNMDGIIAGPTQLDWTKINLDFGAGQHTIEVIAVDGLGNEGRASATMTVRLSDPTTPPPPPPPAGTPVEIGFTPTFRHTNWINNVDRIEAGGPNGFNVRYDAIDSDLRQMSTVVGQINTALNSPGTGSGQQVLTPGLDFVTVSQGSGGDWTYDRAGAVHPAGGTGGGAAVMDLTLPDQIRLGTFRALGLYPGSPVRFNLILLRASLSDATKTDELTRITLSGPGITNPYDVTVPVLDRFALVDTGAFRYYVLGTAELIQTPGAVSVATIQFAFTSA